MCIDGILRPAEEVYWKKTEVESNVPSYKKAVIYNEHFFSEEESYDLECEDVHHFYANGILVSNSHSLSYSLVSYWTAYLKANFPKEFIEVLLNVTSVAVLIIVAFWSGVE